MRMDPGKFLVGAIVIARSAISLLDGKTSAPPSAVEKTAKRASFYPFPRPMKINKHCVPSSFPAERRTGFEAHIV